MNVSSVSPAFCGLKEKILVRRNIRKVSRMASDAFFTQGKKVGKDGSFVVNGFAPMLPSKVSPTSLIGPKPEPFPSFSVSYSPLEGLKTKIRAAFCPDVQYTVSQMDEAKEPLIDIFYKGKKLGETQVSEELQGKIAMGELDIKNAIGKIVPTLSNIKK